MPDTLEVFARRGDAYFQTKQYSLAVRDYDEAIRQAPESARVHNNLAWLLATAEDPSVRDGNRAVDEAQMACRLSQWSNNCRDTLAAAYARTGAFPEAIESQQKALAGPDSAGNAGMRDRLVLYQSRKPWPPD
jgi:tetratricopeptide (TPR) repeat protein